MDKIDMAVLYPFEIRLTDGDTLSFSLATQTEMERIDFTVDGIIFASTDEKNQTNGVISKISDKKYNLTVFPDSFKNNKVGQGKHFYKLYETDKSGIRNTPSAGAFILEW